MKKIVHISDLHFGTEQSHILPVLIDDIQNANPDIIIVSGDLTQRATIKQFQAAQTYLKKFSAPVLCVQGNHDIPLFNIIRRLLYPYAKYKKWIASHFIQQYSKAPLAILGINSVTPFKPMGGFITEKQLARIHNFFESQPKNSVRIIVMHHNLIKSERHKIINDADKIINIFAQSKINLVLSGHIHHAYIELLKKNFLNHNMYVITAGTAISTRTVQPNSYNILEILEKEFILSVRSFENLSFITTHMGTYKL